MGHDVMNLRNLKWNGFFFNDSICKMAFLFGMSMNLSAFELEAAIGTTVEATDNVRESSSNIENDVIQRVIGEIRFEEIRKRIKADANLKLEHEKYYNDTYGDETSLTSGFGLFSVDLIDDFFNVQATFSRDDVLTDSAQDENPDTREFRNIFRAGPTINYAISRSFRMNARANYVEVDNSDETATDSERVNASLGFSNQVNSLMVWKIDSFYEDEIDTDSTEEITNSRISGGFKRAFTDGFFDFNYGIQALRSSITDTERGNYFDISIQRERVLRHTLNLSYEESVSDTGIGFESDESRSEVNTDELNPVQATSTTDIEKRKRTVFRVNRDLSSFLYDFAAIYEESEFKVANNTERYRSLIFGYQPKLFSRFTPRIEYQYIRQSFGLNRSVGNDVRHKVRLSGAYELIKDLYLNGFATYQQRENDDNTTREFDESSLGLGLRWEFL